LADPTSGVRFDVKIPPGVKAELDRDPARHLVTLTDVRSRFDGIVSRSKPGSYPGSEPLEREGERLGDAIGHRAAWVLMSPHNFSVARRAFWDVGGFDVSLPFCEGWDLALRLEAAGTALRRIGSATSYHLYHYRALDSFQEDLRRYQALSQIAHRHGCRAIMLVLLLFRHWGRDPWLPRELGPRDLDHFAELLASGDEALGPFERVLRGHPRLWELEQATRDARCPMPSVPQPREINGSAIARS
jgi:hypothetical protein